MARISYIDIAKGILISFLVFHHLVWVAQMVVEGPNDFLEHMWSLQMDVFVGYFMQAFFVIAGFCSNFDSPWKDFLWRQVKTLLLPNFIFTVFFHLYHGEFVGSIYDIVQGGGWFWFLTALFLAKIVYYFVRRWIANEYVIFGLFVLASFVGTCLNDHELLYNYWWHRHMFTLLLFLPLGNWLRRHLHDSRIWIFGIAYVAGIAICHFLQIKVPYLTAYFFVTKYTWALHVLIAVSGSVIFLKLCSLLRGSAVFEHIGQNTLIIYFVNLDVLYPLIENFQDVYVKNTTEGSLLATFAIWTSAMVVGVMFAWVVNRRYLRFMIGR